MISDPVADLLTRMRNACLVQHRQLSVPYSRQKEALLKVLVKTGHAGSYQVKDRQLIISQPQLKLARRLSKPGSRHYCRSGNLGRFCRGRGETILSTSKGLLTAREAAKQKLGGELLAYVQK